MLTLTTMDGRSAERALPARARSVAATAELTMMMNKSEKKDGGQR